MFCLALILAAHNTDSIPDLLSTKRTFRIQSFAHLDLP